MRSRSLFSNIYIIAFVLLPAVALAQQTVYDWGGAISSGGTSQQIMPYNQNRKYLLIENPVSATEALFCNFTGAAATSGATSFSLNAGGSYERSTPNFVPRDAINCTATTAGHLFIAKEG